MTFEHVLGTTLVSFTLCAEEIPPDKSRYSLIRPTPRALMREMSTDRPDQTESAYTVDAGHFQFESDLFSYSRDAENAGRSESFAALGMNLKLGLLNNVDLQLGINPYLYERAHDASHGASASADGFGELVTRLKINLWGNDSGPFAISLMPFVKFPTGDDDLTNGAYEGGVIIPLAFSLPAGWGLGLMTEFDLFKNSVGSSYHVEFVNSVTLSHDIWGPLAGYIEFFTVVSNEAHSSWQGFFDIGFTWSVTQDIRFDAGVNIGVTPAAPDLSPFLGLAFRF